jgi:uncharacterized protein YjeT (DUF2065 family)
MKLTTILIAELTGPIALALGIGILISPEYYRKIYRHLEKEGIALVIGAIIGMGGGLLIILNHNVWDTTEEIVVSLIGWITLIKGVSIAVLPKVLEKTVGSFNTLPFLRLSGGALIVLGSYLSYVAYLK